jgi:hypothetical protein
MTRMTPKMPATALHRAEPNFSAAVSGGFGVIREIAFSPALARCSLRDERSEESDLQIPHCVRK